MNKHITTKEALDCALAKKNGGVSECGVQCDCAVCTQKLLKAERFIEGLSERAFAPVKAMTFDMSRSEFIKTEAERMEKGGTKKFIWAIGGLVAACLVVAGVWFVAGNSPAEKVLSGTVVFVVGDAQLKTADGKISSLNVADRIGNGDSIITAKDATVSIQLSEMGVVRVQPGSTLRMSTLVSGSNTEMYLERGEVLAKVSRLKKDEKFNVKTPTSVAGVRGTEFSVRVASGKKDIVAVREGKVAVAPKRAEAAVVDNGAAGSADVTVVEAGNSAEVSTVSQGAKPAEDVVVRPISKVETLTIEKVAAVPIIPEAEKKTAEQITTAQAPVVQKEAEINTVLVVEVRKEKIEQLIKDKPKTMAEIKEVFERIDEITLYNGQIVQGAIISRGRNYQVLTLNGTMIIPENKVRKVTVLK